MHAKTVTLTNDPLILRQKVRHHNHRSSTTILHVHTFLIMGSSVVVTLWNILLTPAKGTSFLVETRS